METGYVAMLAAAQIDTDGDDASDTVWQYLLKWIQQPPWIPAGGRSALADVLAKASPWLPTGLLASQYMGLMW